MITKASILWTLAFVICSFAQTTTDGTDPSQITPTFSAPSLSEFAASAGSNPDNADTSNSGDVAATTPDDTTQPDSDTSNTDSTVQSTDTPSETDNTTQGSDEPDDLTTSAGSDTALTDSGDVAPTTPDGTTEPGSDEQSADTSSGTDNTTQSSGEPDDSLPTNVITHTADEASIGADDALELNTDGNSGAQDGTDQGSGEPDGAEQNSTGSDATNSTENNATLEDSTLTATNETEGLVHDAHNYPEGVNASTPFPQSVITEMSKREMRYHHYLWHQVREGWNKFTPEVQQRYTELGWAPPRPARNYDEEGSVSPIMDNDSGEDFLYMHREMINTVNEIITRNNESYGNVTGWKTIPAPGDPDWPVPDNYTIPGDPLAENSSLTRKSDEYFARIQNAEITFKDPDQLRSMTLGELGARMEVTIHAWLHMRFSENCSVGIRTEYLNKTNLPYIEKIWDDPLYNWLGDTYSSQVFPTFYKIHGWVDDRIGDWMAANNITELQWNGTWTGGPWENVSPMLMTKQSMNLRGSAAQNAESSGMKHSGGMNVLEEVMDIFLKSGVREVSIADEVKLDWAPWEKLEEPKKV